MTNPIRVLILILSLVAAACQGVEYREPAPVDPAPVCTAPVRPADLPAAVCTYHQKGYDPAGYGPQDCDVYTAPVSGACPGDIDWSQEVGISCGPVCAP